MRVCSGAGCLRAVPDAVRFCDECKPAPTVQDDTRTHTSGYDAELDRLRKSPRWQQRTRPAVIQRQPLCARCQLAITEIVDHIVPAREAIGQARASGQYIDRHAGYFFLSNLQGLCRPCHGAKTLGDKMHTGPCLDVVAAEAAAPKRRYAFSRFPQGNPVAKPRTDYP